MHEIHAETARCSLINELGRVHGRRDVADLAIQHGWPIEQFKAELLTSIVPERRPCTAIGMSDREVADYSILAAVRAADGKRDGSSLRDSLEAESSQAVATALKREQIAPD